MIPPNDPEALARARKLCPDAVYAYFMPAEGSQEEPILIFSKGPPEEVFLEFGTRNVAVAACRGQRGCEGRYPAQPYPGCGRRRIDGGASRRGTCGGRRRGRRVAPTSHRAASTRARIDGIAAQPIRICAAPARLFFRVARLENDAPCILRVQPIHDGFHLRSRRSAVGVEEDEGVEPCVCTRRCCCRRRGCPGPTGREKQRKEQTQRRPCRSKSHAATSCGAACGWRSAAGATSGMRSAPRSN